VKLGVLGGTFDPVHLGHLVLGEAAREQLELDRVIFVPTGHSWRKADREITGGEDRLAMLRLATAGNPDFEVSSLEVDRPGPSYTEVTLQALLEEHAGAEIYFILGQDALADLPNWHAPGRILELATLAVASRGDAPDGGGAEDGLPGFEARLVRLQMPAIGVTATDIRARVRDGRSIRYQAPDSVAQYIARRKLYQA
jgi:nicotinate-nucleotide adenylyltransferase